MGKSAEQVKTGSSLLILCGYLDLDLNWSITIMGKATLTYNKNSINIA